MLQELRAPAHRPAESLEKRCERIYLSWGVSTCDANKRYLTGALRVMMGSDHRLAIRKEILGPVAEEYGRGCGQRPPAAAGDAGRDRYPDMAGFSKRVWLRAQEGDHRPPALCAGK